MIKKNWNNPELMELGLEGTQCNEDLVGDAVVTDGEKIIFGCPYCSNRYWTRWGRENHILACHPGQREPGNMLPGEGEGLVPTFS